MRSLAAAFIGIVALEATVQAKVEVLWPEHGSIKLITPKSPSQLNMELPGCLTIAIDWQGDRVEIKKEGDTDPMVVEGGERLRAEGGQLVTLLTLEQGQAHVIVNAEDSKGDFDSRMRSFPISQCPISRLRVSSNSGEKLSNINVGISKEIEDLYLQSQTFLAAN